MAWYAYRFWGSRDGQSWMDVTDIAPHPTWAIFHAVQWARGEVELRSLLNTYEYLQLQRRLGTYRPRGDWKTLAEWRKGKFIGEGVPLLRAVPVETAG